MNKTDYLKWMKENSGKSSGGWYAPWLEEMGDLLERFEIEKGMKSNFFEYQTYKEFLPVYKKLTGEDEETIVEVLQGVGKRYTKEFVIINDKFRQEFIKFEISQGKRNNPNNYGGVASLGSVLRSYLKYLYYSENSHKIYQKENNVFSEDDTNFWVISPGVEAIYWDDFLKREIISLDINNVDDFNDFESFENIGVSLKDDISEGNIKKSDPKAIWDFSKVMKEGDVIYAKKGIRKVIGRGLVVSDYIYDESKGVHKSYRKVVWTHTGEWNLRSNIHPKLLTNLTGDKGWTKYMEDMIVGQDEDPKLLLINEFKEWHSLTNKPSGEKYDSKTINVRVSALLDIESHYNLEIFGETDIEVLNNVKQMIIQDSNYKRYAGITGPAIRSYIRYLETRPVISENEKYSKKEFLEEVFIDGSMYDKLESVLENKKNIILTGAPGVGKTFIAERLAHSIIGEKDHSKVQIVQFHQSYSYEDFIEGYRPKADAEGFELREGPFVKFSRLAQEDPENKYFFIIDEINRGNMSKIFGELMMLIENDKRGDSINLLYSSEKFSVPENLYIIGMMNTADRSLALIDYALRRRFSFIEIPPALTHEKFLEYIKKAEKYENIKSITDKIVNINEDIKASFGSGFRIGHSYFIDDSLLTNTNDRLAEIIEYEISPQLFEYWFDDEEKAEEIVESLKQINARFS